MRKNILLVDLENVPAPRLGELTGHDCEVLIFVGESTTKLPRDLVLEVQKLGANARYVEMSGSGRNALDFHIAYYLGEYAAQRETSSFHVISKDTGFDPLITHLNQKGFSVTRSPSVEETCLLRRVPPPSIVKPASDRVSLIAERIRSQPKNRPQRRNSLESMISSHFAKKLGDAQIAEIVDQLKLRGIILIEGDRIKYTV